ncbi:hypothetical protein HanRHA438_Chr04g0178711 [Helianthus annuus]|nr:hypothetical protein HanIR_Chr04g0182611 [Helianthus annuus]KAJ0927087.1 hypothetical protein HanRHA438_Chr04g0178711 [Helianthus annuus]
MRVRWSVIGGGSPETFSWFLAFSLFLRKRSGSSRGSFMYLLELELIHYIGWRPGSKSCNKNRKECWSEGSPRPRVQRTRPVVGVTVIVFQIPVTGKLDTTPCCTDTAPWSAFCNLEN